MESLKFESEKAKKWGMEGKIASYAYTPDLVVVYRKEGEEETTVAYKCPNCAYEYGPITAIIEWPYKIKCGQCRKLVFKSTKGRGRAKKK
ncbi:MAG: hypothetical protein PHW96_02070 [Candidatus Nanoarchaeia archaeon]|nr:hypothetical protein [Candidatus Nanoarchaeia archaeon]